MAEAVWSKVPFSSSLLSDFRPDLRPQSFLLTLVKMILVSFYNMISAHPIKGDGVELVHKVLEWIVPLANLAYQPLKNFGLLSQFLISKNLSTWIQKTQFHHLQIVFALVAAEEEVAIVEATLVVQLSPFSLILLTIRAPAGKNCWDKSFIFWQIYLQASGEVCSSKHWLQVHGPSLVLATTRLLAKGGFLWSPSGQAAPVPL